MAPPDSGLEWRRKEEKNLLTKRISFSGPRKKGKDVEIEMK